MRDILVVVDMQNDFIDGALGTPEAQGIVERVKEKIRLYQPEDVFATRDTHEANYLETREGRLLPVEHCIRGSKGWQIRADVAGLIDESHVVDKPGFGSLDLARMLGELGETEPLRIELVGLCTDICVVSNALLLRATLPEADLVVDSRCCAGVTPQRHEAALETLRSCQVEVL